MHHTRYGLKVLAALAMICARPDGSFWARRRGRKRPRRRRRTTCRSETPTRSATSRGSDRRRGTPSWWRRRRGLALVNFGCGGATTTSLVSSVGCPDVLPHTTGGVTYPTTTQEAAALSFLNAHKGHIGLITVSIGGNDVTACASQANPIPCVATAVAGITKNVTSLAAALRTAAGPKVPLIGLTYPDVILGSYVYPTHPASASAVSLAKLSVVAFKSLINPALTKAYGSAQAGAWWTSRKRPAPTCP